MAFARRSDPFTSHEAALSVRNLTETQEAILALLKKQAMTDEQLVLAYQSDLLAPQASEQGIRSRRAELSRKGLLVVVMTSITKSGRKARVWKAMS